MNDHMTYGDPDQPLSSILAVYMGGAMDMLDTYGDLMAHELGAHPEREAGVVEFSTRLQKTMQDMEPDAEGMTNVEKATIGFLGTMASLLSRASVFSSYDHIFEAVHIYRSTPVNVPRGKVYNLQPLKELVDEAYGNAYAALERSKRFSSEAEYAAYLKEQTIASGHEPCEHLGDGFIHTQTPAELTMEDLIDMMQDYQDVAEFFNENGQYEA